MTVEFRCPFQPCGCEKPRYKSGESGKMGSGGEGHPKPRLVEKCNGRLMSASKGKAKGKGRGRGNIEVKLEDRIS